MTLPILKASDCKGGYKPAKEQLENMKYDPTTELMLSGDKIFHTVQGEGNWIGHPVTFVRLHFCNLRCQWCLVENTKIKTPRGQKNIQDIKIGDRVIGSDGRNVEVTNKKSKAVSSYYRLQLSTGRTLNVTGDHIVPVVIEGCLGWCKISEIKKSYKMLDEHSRLHYNYFDLISKYVNNSNMSGVSKTDEEDKQYTSEKSQHDSTGVQGEVSKPSDFNTDFRRSQDEGIGGNEEKQSTRDYSTTTSNRGDAEKSIGENEEKQSYEESRDIRKSCKENEGEKNAAENVGNEKKTSHVQDRGKESQMGRYSQGTEVCSELVGDSEKSSIEGQICLSELRYDFFREPTANGEGVRSASYNSVEDLQIKQIGEFSYIMQAVPFKGRQCDLIRIENIDIMNRHKRVYDLTTTGGSFIAEGVVVHNCDSWYTWKNDEKEFYDEPTKISISSLSYLIEKAQRDKGVGETGLVRRVCFTGGEPLVQQKALAVWVNMLAEHMLIEDWDIEIETNGTIMPSNVLLENCKFNCSPKLAMSGNCKKSAYRQDVIQAIVERSKEPCFKFVCSTPEDIDEVLKDFGDLIPREMLYIMPEGVTKEESTAVYEVIADKIIQEGLSTTPRLQNIMFDGAKRGV